MQKKEPKYELYKVFFKKIPAILFYIFNHLKWILRLLIILIISTIVGILIILNSTNPNKYKEEIETHIEKNIGRDIEIKGDLKWQLLSFKPAIEIEDLSISNSSWGKNKNIITAKNIIATISIEDLFSRKITLETLILETPKIYLEISKTGQKNWVVIKDKKQKKLEIEERLKNKNNSKEFEIDIQTIKIKNGEIFYENQKTEKKEQLKLNDFSIVSQNYTSPILIDITTTYKSAIYSGTFKMPSLRDFLIEPKSIPLTGIFNLNNAIINFSGNLNDFYTDSPTYMSGIILFDFKNLGKSLSNIFTMPNFAPMHGKIELIGTKEFLSLKKININYKDATLNGTSEISFDKNFKPTIKADLHIPSFDIPTLFYPQWETAYKKRVAENLPRPKSNTKEIKDPKAFRNTPLPTTILDKANLNINLKIDKLKAMPEMPINNININARLNNGYAVIDPFSFEYMDGTVNIDLIANNSNNTFNGDVSLQAENINLGETINSTGYKNILKGGNTNIDIILNGNGINLEKFMLNLNGYMKAYTTSKATGYKIENNLLTTDLVSSIFRFIGEDIIGTLTMQDKKEKQTEIQCIVTNLNVKNGKTISDKGLAVQTKTANIIIDGLVDFGKEHMDISIVTVVKEGLKISNTLSEIIKIEGSLAKPQIIISQDGLISTVAKTAFTTALVGTLTGGISLVTTGLGLITKSWLANIEADKNPCLTAFNGNTENTEENEFDNQSIIKKKFEDNLKSQKIKIGRATSYKIENTKEKIKSGK